MLETEQCLKKVQTFSLICLFPCCGQWSTNHQCWAVLPAEMTYWWAVSHRCGNNHFPSLGTHTVLCCCQLGSVQIDVFTVGTQCSITLNESELHLNWKHKTTWPGNTLAVWFYLYEYNFTELHNFHFMILFRTTPPHHRGKYCTFYCTMFSYFKD